MEYECKDVVKIIFSCFEDMFNIILYEFYEFKEYKSVK